MHLSIHGRSEKEHCTQKRGVVSIKIPAGAVKSRQGAMTVEKLFSLLAYALVLSVVNAAMYKRYSDCEELPMVVFFTFIIILLIIMLALMIDMPLLAALGVASFIGLAAYYAVDEEKPRPPSRN
jgi:uncharacterized membrane protein YoaK (UPF0700 family)